MRCKEMISIIEQSYPVAEALEWDNVGLLVGRVDKEIKKVYIALDATEEAIEHAVAFQADMLLTHHPLIFSSVKRMTDETFIGNRLITLLENNIACYAIHTNYDILRMADLAADKLGLENVQVLEVIQSQNGKDTGIGCIGDIKHTMTLEACCHFIKERFGLTNVKLFGQPSREIRRVAVCPGSGKSEIEVAAAKGADVLITGDIGHHEGLDALAQGLAIIDAGHYGLEYIFMEDMKRFLKEHISEMIVMTETVKEPFQVL